MHHIRFIIEYTSQVALHLHDDYDDYDAHHAILRMLPAHYLLHRHIGTYCDKCVF